MGKAKEPRIPKRVQRIIDACSSGQTLCVQTAETHLGTKPEVWFLEPSHRPVATISAREATRFLAPSCDGLFGPDSSQTWKAKEGATA